MKRRIQQWKEEYNNNSKEFMGAERFFGTNWHTHTHFCQIPESLYHFRTEDLESFRPCWYLKLDNCVVQMISFRFLQERGEKKIFWCKWIACRIPFYRVRCRFWIHSRRNERSSREASASFSLSVSLSLTHTHTVTKSNKIHPLDASSLSILGFRV